MDEQFQQLQLLQEDGGSPGFVGEIVNLFIEDAGKILGNIAALLSVPPPTLSLYFLWPVMVLGTDLVPFPWFVVCVQGAACRGLR